MAKGITRRTFVAGTAAAGMMAGTAMRAIGSSASQGKPDLTVAHGSDAAKNTRAVVQALGGMGAFVSAGQVVNLLPNAQGSHPGTSTNPTIVKTVVDMCKEAGAAEVRWLSWLPERAWDRSRLKANLEGTGAVLTHTKAEEADKWETFDIPKGITLKQIRIFKALYEGDVFINMPIVKDHAGSRFTGSLKNYMGASYPTDNRKFHPTFKGDDVIHMEQCIADMNLVVRAPDLIIMDAMEILTTNGPFGPGEIKKPEKVIAGVDRVAIDAYGATLLDLVPSDVTMIKKAHEHGLGEIDLNKLSIVAIETA